MSTDHFQTKYASFMEVLVKSTIGETTRLFETVVDELKSEISKLKAENEALKSTCRQKAEAKSFAIRSLSTTQDSAVQCDRGQLFLLVERVGQILNEQGKQCNEEETVYLLLNDHNNGAAKEGNSSSTVSLSSHEDSEPTVGSTNMCAVPDPSPTSACGNETEGPEIDQQCSNEELRKSKGTQVTTVVHPSLEEDHNLRMAQNQPLEAVNYLNVLGRTNDNMEVKSNAGQRLAALGTREMETSEVQIKLPSFGEKAAREQNVQPTMLDKPIGEQKKSVLMEGKTKREAEVLVNKHRNKRKQPSEKVRHLPTTQKGTLLLPSTVADRASQAEAKNSSRRLAASSPQAPLHPLGMHKSSTMLQDAMLLIEAMAQSGNCISTQERAAAQDQCTRCVVTLPSVAQSPLPPQALASQSPATTNKRDDGAEEESTPETLFDTCATESGNSPSRIRVSTVPQPKHGAESSAITPTSLLTVTASPKKLEQRAPLSASVSAEPLETTTGSDLFPPKIFVYSKSSSTKSQAKIAPLSPNQISAVVSTVAAAAAQNKCTSRASSVSAGFSQRKNIVTSKTAAPLVMSQPKISSTEQSSDSAPGKTITVIIPRTKDVASQPQVCETLVAPPNQNSVGPAIIMSSSQHRNAGAGVTSDEKEPLLLTAHTPFILSSLQPECLSQPTTVCESPEITPGEEAAVLSDKSVPRNCPLSSPQQRLSACESLQMTPEEPSEALLAKSVPLDCPLSSLQLESSSRPKSICESSETTPGEQPAALLAESEPVTCSLSSPQLECLSQPTSVCESSEIIPREPAATSSTVNVPVNAFPFVPVIRIKRMSYPVLSTGSFLVSQMCSREKESEVVPPDSTSSSSIHQTSKTTVCPSVVPALPSRTCPQSKDMFTAETLNLSSVSQSAAPGSTLSEASTAAWPPSLPSDVSQPVLEKPTEDFDKAELSAVSDQACKTVTLDDEVIDNAEKDFVSPNDFSNTLQLTPIAQNLYDPHLHMTKIQFLAQLAVTPVIKHAKKTSTNESREGTSTDHRSNSRGKSFFARLGNHLKTRSQAKRAKANTQPLTEKMYVPERAKKARLQTVSTKELESTHEPIPLSTNTRVAPTETELSQICLSSQQSTNISYPESKTTFEPVSVIPQKTIVNLYSFSVKEPTDSTSIITNVSPTEDSATKPFEATSPHSTSTTGTTDMTRFSPLSGFTSNPCTKNAVSVKPGDSTDNLGDSNQNPGSAFPEDKHSVTQATRPAAIAGKPSKDEVTPTNLKAATVCPKSSTTNDATTRLKTKFPAESRKRSLSPKENVKKTHSSCPPDLSAPKKTSPSKMTLTKDYTSPKRSRLRPVGQTDSSFIKNDPRPKPCKSDSLRSCKFLKGEQSSKQESNSLLGKTVSPSTRSPKLAKKGASSRKTRESTAKKSSLQPKSPVKVQKAKKLAKAAKAKDGFKDTQNKVQKRKQVFKHHQKTGNKCSSQSVCSPPKVRAGKAPAVAPPMQLRSVKGKKNQCEECGRVLSSSAALESHVCLHTGHKPFRCARCGKCFPDAKGLKRHGTVHRSDGLHICQQCGKGFVDLNKHLQMVHGKHKPFVCQLCNKAFFTKRDVETHIRTHTGEKPFHCHLCEKKFVRRAELSAHLRWHSGEKRHWCPHCGKGFFDQKNLKRHQYIHTGEKPHSCPHCPKHFTQSGNLKTHVKNVHKVQ